MALNILPVRCLSAAVILVALQLVTVVTITIAFPIEKPPPPQSPQLINDEDNIVITSFLPSVGLDQPTRRRGFLSKATSATMGTFTASSTLSSSPVQHTSYNCNCCYHHRFLHAPSANALVEVDIISSSSSSPNNLYDRPRNTVLDGFFSNTMATGMIEYEKKAKAYKTKLFSTLFTNLLKNNKSNRSNVGDVPVIVEVGMGTFPNAPYYAQALHDNPSIKGLDIISADPNDSMFGYALDSATKVGLVSSSSNSNKNKVSLRSVHAVAELLPFEDNSIDAIVATLTLCSVTDQQQALSEITRVLKSGGQYLFWEHVLSEDDTSLALQQQVLTPLQTLVADGCHLNRRTGMNISNNGLFRGGVDMDYILIDASIIGPTTFGIATA